jgi:hypothetical protein
MKLQTTTFYLRGGHTISVQCESVELTKDTATGAYSGYKVVWGEDNKNHPALLSMSLPDIIAVVVK